MKLERLWGQPLVFCAGGGVTAFSVDAVPPLLFPSRVASAAGIGPNLPPQERQ
jgi:hypothetical protein